MRTKIILFFFVFLFDRLFKRLALNFFPAGNEGDFLIIPGLIDFSFFANHRLAFSLPIHFNLLVILSGAIIACLLVFLASVWQKKQEWLFPAFLAIFLGAASNFYDRLALGFVIDYLHLRPISYFNLADLMIGGGLLFLIKKLCWPKSNRRP